MKITVPIPITPHIIEQWRALFVSDPVLSIAVVVGLIFVILFVNKARKDGL